MNAFLPAPIAYLSPTLYYYLHQARNGSANGRVCCGDLSSDVLRYLWLVQGYMF